jgi:hypothetical protein
MTKLWARTLPRGGSDEGFAMLIAINVIAASAAPIKSRAQSSATGPTAPATGMKPDRTTTDPATRKAMREKETARGPERTQTSNQTVISGR